MAPTTQFQPLHRKWYAIKPLCFWGTMYFLKPKLALYLKISMKLCWTILGPHAHLTIEFTDNLLRKCFQIVTSSCFNQRHLLCFFWLLNSKTISQGITEVVFLKSLNKTIKYHLSSLATAERSWMFFTIRKADNNSAFWEHVSAF